MISPSKLWMWDRFEILDGNFRLNPLKSKIDLGLSLSNYQSWNWSSFWGFIHGHWGCKKLQDIAWRKWMLLGELEKKQLEQRCESYLKSRDHNGLYWIITYYKYFVRSSKRYKSFQGFQAQLIRIHHLSCSDSSEIHQKFSMVHIFLNESPSQRWDVPYHPYGCGSKWKT